MAFVPLSRSLRAVFAVLLTATLLLTHAPPAAAVAPTGQPNWMQGFDDALETGSVISTTWLGNRTYIGGTFSSAGGQVHSNVAAIDMDDRRVDHGFVANTDGPVYSVLAAADGSGIYIGGEFTTINGVAQANFAKVDAATGQVISVDQGINGPVKAMATMGSRLYVGGSFSFVGTTQRKDLAAFDNDVLSSSWKVNTNGKVRDLKLTSDGTTLFAAGTFTALDGVQAPQRIAKISALTGAAQVWDVGTTNHWVVIDLTLSDDDNTLFLVAGGWPSQGGNRTKAIDVATGAEMWNVLHGGDPQAALFHEGLVYVGGHFEDKNGAYPNQRLQAIDAATGVTDPWKPILNSVWGVWDLDASPWGMLVGGDFTNIDGRSARGIAVYPQLDFGLGTPPGPIDTVDPTSAFVSPVPGGSINLPDVLTGSSSDDVAVQQVKVTIRNFTTGQFVQPDGQSLASTWAKIEPTFTPAANVTWSISLANLPAGIYRARVKTADTSGNETGWSATHDFNVLPGAGADTTAPVGVVSPLAGDLLTLPGAVSGTASDDVEVSEVRVTIRNRTTKDYVQADGTSVAAAWAKLVPTITPGTSVSWNLPLDSLPPGPYQARVKVIDSSGNQSSWSTSYNFTIS